MTTDRIVYLAAVLRAMVLAPLHQRRDRRSNLNPDRRKRTTLIIGGNKFLVRALEAVARHRRIFLSEDEREVLRCAQSRIRVDGTANGYRSGFDRRRK